MLNLFTMVITEAFEVMRDESRAKISSLVPDFRRTWALFDTRGVGAISPKELGTFIGALAPPLGCNDDGRRAHARLEKAGSTR